MASGIVHDEGMCHKLKDVGGLPGFLSYIFSPYTMQMFMLGDDLARSTKFPIKAYFINLRGMLGIPYQDGFLANPRLDEAIATACSGIEVRSVCMHSYKLLGWAQIAFLSTRHLDVAV